MFDVLKPAGIQARHIHELWNVTLVVCMVVFVAILAALVLALWRSSRARAGAPRTGKASPTERQARRWVIGATAASAAGLIALVTVDVITDRALSRLPVADALRIELTGYQWWWEATYPSEDGRSSFSVSSDLHVPVGQPVVVSLKSPDVIHSFWVPSLHGKKDMLPGRPDTITFRADRPGAYRGQCAEFCGAEHALMAFGITAESPEQFAQWRARQQAPETAPAAQAVQALRGRELFLANDCAGCHTIRGTSAAGTLGPDLTHVASRPAIGAGTIPTNFPNLLSWIYDPGGHKPLSTMPPGRLSDEDLRAIATYLAGLT